MESTECRFFFFFSSRRRHTRCGRDWSSDVCSSDLARMQAGFVERRNGDVRRVADLCCSSVGEPDQPVVDVFGQMMLAVHVEEHARPDSAFGIQVAERLHPDRFDEEKIESLLGAMLLHAMNEQIVRIQLVGHHQIINPRHASQYFAGKPWLSMAAHVFFVLCVCLLNSICALSFFVVATMLANPLLFSRLAVNVDSSHRQGTNDPECAPKTCLGCAQPNRDAGECR